MPRHTTSKRQTKPRSLATSGKVSSAAPISLEQPGISSPSEPHDQPNDSLASKGLLPAPFPTASIDLFLAQESLSASRRSLQPLTQASLSAWRASYQDNSPLAEISPGMVSNYGRFSRPTAALRVHASAGTVEGSVTESMDAHLSTTSTGGDVAADESGNHASAGAGGNTLPEPGLEGDKPVALHVETVSQGASVAPTRGALSPLLNTPRRDGSPNSPSHSFAHSLLSPQNMLASSQSQREPLQRYIAACRCSVPPLKPMRSVVRALSAWSPALTVGTDEKDGAFLSTRWSRVSGSTGPTSAPTMNLSHQKVSDQQAEAIHSALRCLATKHKSDLNAQGLHMNLSSVEASTAGMGQMLSAAAAANNVTSAMALNGTSLYKSERTSLQLLMTLHHLHKIQSLSLQACCIRDEDMPAIRDALALPRASTGSDFGKFVSFAPPGKMSAQLRSKTTTSSPSHGVLHVSTASLPTLVVRTASIGAQAAELKPESTSAAMREHSSNFTAAACKQAVSIGVAPVPSEPGHGSSDSLGCLRQCVAALDSLAPQFATAVRKYVPHQSKNLQDLDLSSRLHLLKAAVSLVPRSAAGMFVNSSPEGALNFLEAPIATTIPTSEVEGSNVDHGSVASRIASATLTTQAQLVASETAFWSAVQTSSAADPAANKVAKSDGSLRIHPNLYLIAPESEIIDLWQLEARMRAFFLAEIAATCAALQHRVLRTNDHIDCQGQRSALDDISAMSIEQLHQGALSLKQRNRLPHTTAFRSFASDLGAESLFDGSFKSLSDSQRSPEVHALKLDSSRSLIHDEKRPKASAKQHRSAEQAESPAQRTKAADMLHTRFAGGLQIPSLQNTAPEHARFREALESVVRKPDSDRVLSSSHAQQQIETGKSKSLALDLSHNQISDRACFCIAQLMLPGPGLRQANAPDLHLHTLNLPRNTSSEPESRAVAISSSSPDKHTQHVADFRANSQPLAIHLALQFPTYNLDLISLQSLDLSSNPISDVGLGTILAVAMKGSAPLRHLAASTCNIRDNPSFAATLGSFVATSSTLQHLDLSHNRLGALCGLSIAAALPKCKALKRLHIGFNQFGHCATMEILLGSFWSNQLIELNVQNTVSSGNSTDLVAGEFATQSVWARAATVDLLRSTRLNFCVEEPARDRRLPPGCEDPIIMAAASGPDRSAVAWDASDGVFAPRALESESGSLFDSIDLLHESFLADWARAKIPKLFPEDSTRFAVQQFVSRRYPMIRELYRYCVCSRPESGITGLTTVDWSYFWRHLTAFLGLQVLAAEDKQPDRAQAATESLKLAVSPAHSSQSESIVRTHSHVLRQADLDNIFIAATWQSPGTKHVNNPGHLMVRFEFVEAIVRMALIIRVPSHSKDEGAKVTSIDLFLGDDLLRFARQVLGIDKASEVAGNTLRHKLFYSEANNIALVRSLSQIRSIFAAYSCPRESDVVVAAVTPAATRKNIGRLKKGTSLMNFRQFLVCIDEVWPDRYSTVEVNRSFVFSTMTHADELARSRRQSSVEELTFCDFMEAICRLAWYRAERLAALCADEIVAHDVARIIATSIQRRFGGSGSVELRGKGELLVSSYDAFATAVNATVSTQDGSHSLNPDPWMSTKSEAMELFRYLAELVSALQLSEGEPK